MITLIINYQEYNVQCVFSEHNAYDNGERCLKNGGKILIKVADVVLY